MCHGQEKNRQTKEDGNHEAPRHIVQFPAPGILTSRIEWLECHAALWAVARMFLPDLWVHRTSVNGILGDGHFLSRRLQKLLSAMIATKVKHLSPALAAKSGGFIHLHATDRIDCHFGNAW